MRIDSLLLVTGAFRTIVWVFLLVQGVRLRLIRHYTPAYLYFACQFVVFWGTTAAVATLGVRSPRYVWIYYGTVIPTDFLGLLIVLWFYFLPYKASIRRDWILSALLPLFASMSLSEPMHPLHRVSYVIYFYLATVGLLAAWRLYSFRKLTLGANLRGLFYGIYIPAGMQALNQALNYLGREIWTYDAFRVVNELTTAISWGIIAFGMRRYDPPTLDKRGDTLGREEAVSVLKGLRKELRRWP